MGEKRILSGRQMHFYEVEGDLELSCQFPIGITIYPERYGSVMLKFPLSAQRLKCKIRGLTGYEAKSLIHYHRDGRSCSLPTGTLFGAYADKARK